MRLKFALVGTGFISQYYLKALRNNKKNVDIVALCDLDYAKEKIADTFQARFYTDYKKMILENSIDCVVVLTPNFTHYDIIKFCLDKGVNVLCEKPLCITYTESKNLVDLAYHKKLLLTTSYHRRFNDKIIKLKKYSQKHKINSIHFRYLENINEHSMGDHWYLNPEQSGGGCVLDNGINVFDCLFYLLGNLQLDYSYLGYKKFKKFNIDINAYIILSNKYSSMATVELDWLHDGEIKDLSVYFDNGKHEMIDLLANFGGFKQSLWHEYSNIINCFVEDVLKNKTDKDTNSLRAIDLVEQIYKNI